MIGRETADVGYQMPAMSDAELSRFIELINRECGIMLTPAKKSMVSARLSRRLRALGLPSFRHYYDYVNDPKSRDDEIGKLVDVITTNTTEFFREKKHFDQLVETVIPELTRSSHVARGEPIRVWSAACSSGEEPYTIAMVLADHFKGDLSRFVVYATDISTEVLLDAKRAVYTDEDVQKIPSYLRLNYMMRGRGRMQGHWRVVPELRERIRLDRLNFLDHFRMPEPMDVIFCRNALIYFDVKTKTKIVEKLHNSLAPGGFFFVGHSESLNGINRDFVQVVPTVYIRPRGPIGR